MSKDTTKKAKAKTVAKAPVKKANPLLEDETDEVTDTEVEQTEVEDTDVEDAESEDEQSDEEEVEDDEEVEAPAPTKSKTKAMVTQDVAPVRVNSPLEKQALTDIEMTRQKLAKQPKVRFIVPLQAGEKKGVAIESVNINGLRIEVKKGIWVEVPQAVATQLEQHYNMGPEDTEVGEAYRLDKNRAKDGSTTDEALLNG